MLDYLQRHIRGWDLLKTEDGDDLEYEEGPKKLEWFPIALVQEVIAFIMDGCVVTEADAKNSE